MDKVQKEMDELGRETQKFGVVLTDFVLEYMKKNQVNPLCITAGLSMAAKAILKLIRNEVENEQSSQKQS